MAKPGPNKLNKSRYGYLFIAPFFVVFAIFGLYPILYTVFLSFQKWDGLALSLIHISEPTRRS